MRRKLWEEKKKKKTKHSSLAFFFLVFSNYENNQRRILEVSNKVFVYSIFNGTENYSTKLIRIHFQFRISFFRMNSPQTTPLHTILKTFRSFRFRIPFFSEKENEKRTNRFIHTSPTLHFIHVMMDGMRNRMKRERKRANIFNQF